MNSTCFAEITVENDNILLEGVSEKNYHKCKPILRLSTNRIGMVDGFHFEKQEQGTSPDTDKWKCINCDCIIQTKSDDFILKYPHSEKMHKCIK